MNKLLVVTLMNGKRISCFCCFPKKKYLDGFMIKIDGLVEVGCIDKYEFHTLRLNETAEIKEFFDNRYYSDEYPEEIVEKFKIDDLMKIGDFAIFISGEVETVFNTYNDDFKLT